MDLEVNPINLNRYDERDEQEIKIKKKIIRTA